jgi:hypothetical protein
MFTADGVIVLEHFSPVPGSFGFFFHFGKIWQKSR